MNLNIICQVLKADLLERTRRFSFLALCTVGVFLAFFSVPDVKAPFVSIAIEPEIFKQGSNPSWIPMAVSLCGGLLFPFIGLSYIKNNISSDRKTGLLYLMESMNMKRSSYIIGKFLSNVLLLSFMWILVAVSAGIMVLLRFPNQSIDLYAFITPFFSMVPGLIFASAFAIFLESTALLGNKSGNAVGLTILFIMFLINYLNSQSQFILFRLLDFSSYRWLMDTINHEVIPIIGRCVEETGILVPGGLFADSIGNQELYFHGIIINSQYLVDKFIFSILSLILAGLSIIFLEPYEKKQEEQAKNRRLLIKPNRRKKYFGAFLSEFYMIFNSASKYWILFLLCLWAGTILAPLNYVQNYIWFILLIFSVPIFSQIGCRNYEYGLTDYFITIKSALIKQMVYSYLGGVVLLFIITIPVIVRNLLSNNYLSIISYILFIFFIPAMSCFLGEYSKSRRAFETVYLLICFLLINVPSFLFIGYVTAAMLAGTILFLSITYIKRASL